MRVLLLVLLVALAACSGARPAEPVRLRSEVRAARLQALRADPSIPNWEANEEIVAVCEAGPGETLVLTTHRVLTLKAGWARAPEVQIRGHETIRRQDGGLRLAGQTAIGSTSAAFSTGQCHVDAFEPLVADVIRLRNEGGTAAALLAHHESLRQHYRERAEAERRETAREAQALSAPVVPGLTWADVPDRFARRRALYEHFDVTPSDLSHLARDNPDGLPRALCEGERIGRTCTGFLTVPYGGSCRAAALHYAAHYADEVGTEGTVRIECPDYTVNVGFSFGDISVQQFHDDTDELVYAERGALGLLE